MRGVVCGWVMGVVALSWAAAPALAGVTLTGDTKDDSSSFYAGYNANRTGDLTIDAGSTLSRSYGYLGYAMGSSGGAIVTGAGSQWNNSGQLYVGFSGLGTLRVEAGGQVNDSTGGYVGYNSGSSGTVIVTGAGSKWTNSGVLSIGAFGGSGTLTISDGGLISAKTLFASTSDLYGNGTITVQGGGVVDADLVFDAAHATSTSPFGTGGTLQFATDRLNPLGIGYRHSGSLRIADGRSLSSSTGYLGYSSGSIGTANVTGAGSKWTNSGDLHVGSSGAGTLNLEAGGQVSSITGYLGYESGSSGIVNVTGSGSRLSTSSVLYVGDSGNGTLTIAAGGQVTSNGGDIGYAATGIVTVTGGGSKWTSSGSLSVGTSVGTGTLTISDGGTVSTGMLYASLSDLHGNGTITVQGGAILDADLIFDATHGSTQAIVFGSGGTLQLTIDGTHRLGVGYRHSGSLRIADGKSITSSYGDVGYGTGSTGAAIVTGAGTKWTNSSDLTVGDAGGGMLKVEAGGQINSVTGYVGNISGVSGAVSITGPGSTWANSRDLFIGRAGNGALNLEAGGQISNSGVGYIGYTPGSSGAAIVVGAGSKWANSTQLYVGYSGVGTLNVEDGGLASSTTGYLASGSGASGSATITGMGSKWTNSGWLYIGYSGRGALAVSDGGQVTATSLSIGNSQSSLRLHVSGDNLLLLGNSSIIGAVSNNGRITFLADAFLPGGIYRPIGEYGGRSLSWSGNGSTSAVGGVWDSVGKTFTVVAPTIVEAGAAADAGSGQRLLISEAAGGYTHPTWRAGVSFGTLTSGTSLISSPLSDSESAMLMPLLGPGEMVLAGGDFAGALAGGEALLSFEVGLGAGDVQVWRFSQSGWSAYTPQMMTYDAHGVVSFTVDPASLDGSGYAVSGTVPEPGAIGVLAMGAWGLVVRRRARLRRNCPHGGRGCNVV